MGKAGWERERFLTYARLYRPSAIVCFSVEARRFCVRNPDLVRISFHKNRLLVGTVLGFEGPAIRGRAEVAAEPGRLRVTGLVPDLDGLVVLRYHVVPGLRCQPADADRADPAGGRPRPIPRAYGPRTGQTQTLLDIGFPPGR